MNFFNRKNGTDVLDREGFDAATTAVEDISGDYTLDVTHSRLGFSARHAMVTTVRGAFPAFEGTATIDTANPAASQGRLTIDVSSVDTGTADRDGHLRSADFFDVENHPTMTFVSTSVEREGNEWAITGDLTIKDVTKPVTVRLRGDRLGPRPLRQPARRLRGRGHHQPQGLGPHLERRARDRRRPGLGEDQARLRHLRDPQRLTAPLPSPAGAVRFRHDGKWGGPVGHFVLHYGPCPHRSPCPTASSSAR